LRYYYIGLLPISIAAGFGQGSDWVGRKLRCDQASFSGWLTEDRDGKMRVNVPLDGILRAQDYYFQVSNDHRGE
jgi:hypothetical protein